MRNTMHVRDVVGCDALEGDGPGSVSKVRSEPLQDRSTMHLGLLAINHCKL